MSGADLVILAQMSNGVDKRNFLEFWDKMAEMTLKVKVNDLHFQYLSSVSRMHVWCKFDDSSSNLWVIVRTR